MATDAWQQFDCYKVLGVHVAATTLEIRKAYYRASRDVHPDRGGSHDAQIRVNLAYEVLADPVTRQAHDLFWYRFRGPAAAGREGPARPGGPAGPVVGADEPLGALLLRVQEVLGHAGRASAPAAPPPQASPAPSAPPHRPGRGRRWSFATASALSGLALGASLEGFHAVWLGAGVGWLAFTATGLRRHRGPSRPAREASGDGAAVRPRPDAPGDAAREIRDPRLAQYVRGVATLGGLLLRPTDLDDSEEQLARRITAALFVMGYKPLGYDRRYRLLLFTDDEERLLIRFRHRSGAAINVSYVQGMVDAMEYTGSSQGILFCSTGLSGNGAALAGRHGIKWYTLTRMNEWIESVIRARYAGPPGDILRLLDHIIGFVNNLSTPLPTQRAGARG
jgi:hypothetical protein